MPSLYGNITSDPNYKFETDIKLITKTSTGKIIFWKGADDPILGISEDKDIYLDVIGGTILLVVDRLFFYSFSFYSLEDLDGKGYGVVASGQGSEQEYVAKLKEVYVDLQSLFVGCCAGGGGTSNVEFYANEAAFPATGEVNILYVDKATPALFIWDGAAYVGVGGGGGGVESVTGDSVDNTDPLNPIVNAVPLSGTTTGNPVTGLIEMGIGQEIYCTGENLTDRFRIRFLDTSIQIGYIDDAIPSSELELVVSNGAPTFNVDIETFGFNAQALLQQSSLKSRLWNKAGVPTTTDDVSQGYVADRSLVLDTTSGIIYKCTSATAGAATWEVYYDPKTTIQSITISGASVTTTANTAQDITGLVTPTLPANSVWFFEIDMLISCTGTGGVRLGFTAPSGATGQLSVIGTATSLTTYLQTSTTGALPAIAMNRFNGGSYVRMTGRVKIGATAGAVQLQFASGTSGQTSTIFGDFESVMNLKRLL